MMWFRAGSSVASIAIRRNLCGYGSYTTRVVVNSHNRFFHGGGVCNSKAQAVTAPLPVPLSRLADSFLDGSNSAYVEELHKAWEANPRSVDESWDHFFRNFVGQAVTTQGISGQTIQESMQLLLLVKAYQVCGHLKANLDPLGLEQRTIPDDLKPGFYGFTEADLEREFFVGMKGMSGFLSESRPVQTLRSILDQLNQAYCGNVGYEYSHILDHDKCNWLRERIETLDSIRFNQQQHRRILGRLAQSTLFENFMATKWSTAKRFGLEGGETLIPGMMAMFDKAADLGVVNVVFGICHRGRLNILGNVVKKPIPELFSEFVNGPKLVDEETLYDCPTRGGKQINLSLVANPNHVEGVYPIVVGKTRAKQYYLNDLDRSKTVGVLVHGDGSFAGQGPVYETLQLSALPSYTTGGTIHIILNNQVAFTTDPRSGRSSEYCTDVAKVLTALNAPIFHVNGDDVEAVVRVCELAAEWRQTFNSDVFIDLVCYRRFGHNEIDEPSFTQPRMYQVIRNHPTALDMYQKKLLESGLVIKEDITKMYEEFNSFLKEGYLASKDFVPKKRSSQWSGLKSPEQLSRIRNIGVKSEILKDIGRAITTLPDNFKQHRAVKKVYDLRAQMVEMGEGIDWALAEALAFATLLIEGNHVRLTGQDVERGTFTHRHAVVHDRETGRKYCPLSHVVMNQKEDMFTVCNSSLSEFGVLGFEFGYSIENPNTLVLWEAQFGDFANGAQVIFDHLLSSGECRWFRQTGIVVLLPHGYDGQGPEHSSARLERFLQMSDENPYVIPEMESNDQKQIQECNWQVVNVTTPANYFHVLRRQMHRDFRKPLIVMSPKNLLRHKECKSNFSELEGIREPSGFENQGGPFQRLIGDQTHHSDTEDLIRRLILCSGKVYYELDERRKKVEANDIAICRIEQLSPFPFDLIQRELKRYPKAEVVWCQEEPMNMGAYNYIAPRLWTCMKAVARGTMEDIKYVGRPPSAATATAFPKEHSREQTEFLEKAMQREAINFPF